MPSEVAKLQAGAHTAWACLWGSNVCMYADQAFAKLSSSPTSPRSLHFSAFQSSAAVAASDIIVLLCKHDFGTSAFASNIQILLARETVT